MQMSANFVIVLVKRVQLMDVHHACHPLIQHLMSTAPALSVTSLTALIAQPMAYYAQHAKMATRNLLIIQLVPKFAQLIVMHVIIAAFAQHALNIIS
jgi:ABC-type spermidine/putrescine transport system permease subunit I